MRTVDQRFRTRFVALAVCSALGWQAHAVAQDAQDENGEELEEVVATGRFISSSQQLVNERMNDAFATGPRPWSQSTQEVLARAGSAPFYLLAGHEAGTRLAGMIKGSSGSAQD